MLHSIGDCLFRSDSPYHHESWSLLETFIAERITSREGEWFPCMSHNLRSLQSAFSEVQAKHVELKKGIDTLQISAANATAATERRIDALQFSTDNTTRGAARQLQKLEDELSKCYFLNNECANFLNQQQSLIPQQPCN